MTEGAHRVPIGDKTEAALHRLLEASQNLQRRIFRLARRGFITPTSVGELGYDAASISRDVADLEMLADDRPPRA